MLPFSKDQTASFAHAVQSFDRKADNNFRKKVYAKHEQYSAYLILLAVASRLAHNSLVPASMNAP